MFHRAKFGLPRAKIWLLRANFVLPGAKFWLLLSLGCFLMFRLFTTKLDLLWAALFQFLWGRFAFRFFNAQ